MNGFGNSASDMDLCLMLSHSEVSLHLLTVFSARLRACHRACLVTDMTH